MNSRAGSGSDPSAINLVTLRQIEIWLPLNEATQNRIVHFMDAITVLLGKSFSHSRLDDPWSARIAKAERRIAKVEPNLSIQRPTEVHLPLIGRHWPAGRRYPKIEDVICFAITVPKRDDLDQDLHKLHRLIVGGPPGFGEDESWIVFYDDVKRLT